MDSTETKSKVEKETIDSKLLKYVEGIDTVEGWKAYISLMAPSICEAWANMESLSKSAGNDSTRGDRKPVAVITGGQPGSGKTALIGMYGRTLTEEGYNPIMNNADDYRYCVTGSDKIVRDFPERASEITDPVVKLMRKKLTEKSIEGRQSLILENTLGDRLAADQIINAGVYDVRLALMAVPREESLLSTFERYIKLKEASRHGRLVTIAAHDKRYKALDEIAGQLEQEGVRVIVHSRGKDEKTEPIIRYDSKDPKLSKSYNGVRDAFSSIRAQELKKGVSGYKARLAVIRDKMEDFGMTPDEEKELEQLEEIVGKSVDKELGDGGKNKND